MISTNTPDRSAPPAEQRRVRPFDGRGVSEVLGAILMFALLILLIAIIQLNAVPAANQQVEFEHNQRAQGDLQEFQEVFLRSATTDTDGSVAIEVGTAYPSRFFLFNPPDPTGTLSVSDGGDAVINNARATGEAGDYLNGNAIRFDTRHVVYSPNYNEYRNPPTTVYENGVLYNEFQNEQRVVNERGGLINGRTVSLIALQGQYSTGSSGSVSFGTTPISSPAQTVSVTDDPAVANDEVTITVPTRLSEGEWEDLLSDEEYVDQVVKNSNGSVSIYLTEGETYNLRMAAVGVGGEFETETQDEYIVDLAGAESNVPEQETQQLVVQVRDKFNNPVTDTPVSFRVAAGSGSVDSVGPARTDEDGTVTLEYTADGIDLPSESVTVEAWIGESATPPTEPARVVSFELSVFDVDGSGANAASGGNPINPTDVRLVSSELISGTCNTRSDGCTVDLTFENTGTTTQQIEELRISHYSVNNPSGSGQDYEPPEKVVIEDNNGSSNTLDVDGTSQPLNVKDLNGGGTETYNFEFREFERVKNNQLENGVKQGDFFVIEVRFRDSTTLTDRYVTYFIAPY